MMSDRSILIASAIHCKKTNPPKKLKMIYCKCTKITNTIPYFCFFMQFIKILNLMENSVNHDQTALEQSDLGLHCLHMPF